MIEEGGDKTLETRDRNLSSIISRIRDDGPALPSFTEAPPPSIGDRDFSAELTPSETAQVFQRASPPFLDKRPVDNPAPSGAEGANPNVSPPPVSCPQPFNEEVVAKRRGWVLVTVVLAAALLAGGVVAVMYWPTMEAHSPLGTTTAVDPGLHSELSDLQASVANLSQRVQSLTADRESKRSDDMGERLNRMSQQMEELVRETRAPDGTDNRLDRLAERLDAMAIQMGRLAADSERSRRDAAPAPGDLKSETPSASGNRPDRTADRAPISSGSEVSRGDTAIHRNQSLQPEDQTSTRSACGPDKSSCSSATGDTDKGRTLQRSQTLASEANREHDGKTGDAATPKGDERVAQISDTRRSLNAASAPPNDVVASTRQNGARNANSPEYEGNRTEDHPLGSDSPTPAAQEELLSMAETNKANAKAVAAVADASKGKLEEKGASGDNTARAVASGEEWVVNLAAVRSESAALDLQRAYREKGLDAQVLRLSKGLFGVRVGGYSSRTEASTAASTLQKDLGIKGVYISRK